MIKAIIEIPSGCMYKYEHDKDRNVLVLDRPLNQACPVNYGYLPNTLSEDGDPLDVFIISRHPILPLSEVKIEVRTIMFCNDNGVTDNKIISILEGENLNQKEFLNSVDLIENYLKTYKLGFSCNRFDIELEALVEIDYAYDRYNSNMSKLK